MSEEPIECVDSPEADDNGTTEGVGYAQHGKRFKRGHRDYSRPLTPYEQCIKDEIKREKHYRKYSPQGAFEYEMTSLDVMLDNAQDISLLPALSDRGLYAAAIQQYLDGEGPVATFETIVDRARKKVSRINKKLLEVFYLVLKNGKNRDESIWELVRRKSRRRGVGHTSSTAATSKNCSKSSGSKKTRN